MILNTWGNKGVYGMISLLAFIYGLFIGSFLNVIVDRVPIGKSFIIGRSQCDYCHHTLSWFDLIPLFSYLFLSGRCRYCHKHLSLYYPVMELITGLVYIFTANYFLGTQIIHANYTWFVFWQMLYYLLVVSILLVVFFADLRYGIIPFIVIIPGSLIVLLWYIFVSPTLLINHLLTGLGAFLCFVILFIGTKMRGIGFGDVVYAFFMGLLLGFPLILLGLYIAIVVGAIGGIFILLLKKKKLHGSTIPFGPFLVIGTFVCLFYGLYMEQLLSTVLGLPLGR